MKIYKQDIINRTKNRVWSRKSRQHFFINPYNDTFSADVIEAFLAEIMEAVESGETVTITGFGTFSPRQYQARMGTHPQSGAAIQINSRRAPGFRPGEVFKRKVRR